MSLETAAAQHLLQLEHLLLPELPSLGYQWRDLRKELLHTGKVMNGTFIIFNKT